MLDRSSVIARLRQHEAELRAQGVEGLFLFGSVARDEATADSDVDLFFDHGPGLGLELVSIQDRIRDILDAPADVMTRGSLHPLLRERIEAAAERVF